MVHGFYLAVTRQLVINVVVPERNYLEMCICSQLHITHLNHN